ncbi:Gfo/Idh/MocA family protein [Microbacterium sp. RU33B]|uniref:Gfo/Idh/MocA family protein n=1 Tax=Microbacterium sp. RU33B TaxID=1907390 RepID=UPI000968CB30|nr:Gfo/Idh/MocA family oxidoreductase [Microbacterium sp. RU33B]SIT68442.1 Predicted dehydrogenase [Microbacterium sp. RU33B]
MRTRWAVLGPGGISGFFARAMPHSRFGVLHAVGSSDPARAAAFAAEHGAAVSGTYDEILDRDDVDAVYIGTVHTTHARLAEAALAAGKAVLCEKPATPTLEATEQLLAAAGSYGVPFLEAYKWRFGPFAARVADLISDGAIGEVSALETAFGFTAGERSGRLFDPALAGGALLDVGGYPASFAVGVAAWVGIDLDPSVTEVTGTIGDTGVDEEASAVVRFGAFSAAIRTSIVTDLPCHAVIRGTEGRLVLPDAWGTRTESASVIVHERHGSDRVRIDVDVVDPFAAEADAVSLALADGRAQIPEFPWAQTHATARVLSDWRAALHP